MYREREPAAEKDDGKYYTYVSFICNAIMRKTIKTAGGN